MATPYGSWPSPITAASLVEKVVGLSDLRVDGTALCWNEFRPEERGRYTIVRREADGRIHEAIPHGFSARTLVHEYGGASYAVRQGVVWFVNYADQRVWRVGGGHPPAAVTPEGARYADLDVSPEGHWLAAVRERHLPGGDVVNDIVVVPEGGGEAHVVAAGRDFYAAPRWSPDGRHLCWLAWDHPNMPWDGTELWVSDPAGGGARLVAGGRTESVSQPRWAPDDHLLWASDRSGWWNLYREGHHLAHRAAEFSGPDWAFGQHTYQPLPGGRIVAAYAEAGRQRLAVISPDGRAHDLPTRWTSFSSVRAWGDGQVVAIAASPTEEPAIVAIPIDGGEPHVLHRSRDDDLDRAWLSEPEAIEFPTTGRATAHALWYPPCNPEVAAPDGERPPLVVMSHGGPTGSASATLNRRIQFWTSRGIGVVDVNYRGSTGYGRAYRDALRGQWGVVDVDDCVAAARFLADRGAVDGERMVIRGGSAGGYTTLCALTFRPGVFAAGASYYGVADAEALARDTHKFESRYLDGLIGRWPDDAEVYRQRSPIHHTEHLAVPLILFQGLEDKVVPPSQAEAMVAALRAKGIPFAYVAFEGEQHGFRQAPNVVRSAELELWFYGRVLGFDPADEIEPVVIENEEVLASG